MKKIMTFITVAVLTTPAWADLTGSNNATQGQKLNNEQQQDLSATGKDAWAAEMSFKRLDANDDGVISRPETLSAKPLMNTFDKFDKNKDGNLDTAEFAAFAEENSKSILNENNAAQQSGGSAVQSNTSGKQ